MPNYTIKDSKGITLLNENYDKLNCYYNNKLIEKEFLFNFKSKGKNGIIDKNGKIIIEPIYDQISSIKYTSNISYYIVELNNKIGVINENGKIIIDISHEKQYSDPEYSDGMILLKKNGKKIYYNESGEKSIEITAAESYSFSNGLALIKKDGYCEFIDKNGETAISNKYTEGYSFSEGKDYTYVMQGGKWGIIDKNGKSITNFEFDKFEFVSNSEIIVVKNNKLSGFIKISSNKYSTTKYYKDFKIRDNEFIIVKEDKLWGVVDINDMIILPFEFDEIEININQKLFFARKKKKWNIYSFENAQEPIYITEQYLLLNDKVIIKQKDGFYIVDEKISLKIEIDDAIKTNDDYLIFSKNGKLGIMDQNTKIIIENQYETIDFSRDFQGESFNKDLFIVGINEAFGVVNTENEVLCPIEFEKISINKGIIIKHKNGLFGYIDYINEFESDSIYKNIDILFNGKEKLTLLTKEDSDTLDTGYFVHRTEELNDEFAIILLSKKFKNQMYIIAIGKIGGGQYGEHISKIENIDNWDITKGVFTSNFDFNNWEYGYENIKCNKINSEISIEDKKIFESLYDELFKNYVYYDDEINDELPLLKDEFLKKLGKSRYKSSLSTWCFRNLSHHWGLNYKW
jgi:hypothetical protein